jgi:hypothetical protein
MVDEVRAALDWRLRLDVDEPNAVVAVAISPEGVELGFASAGPSRDADLDGDWELYALNTITSAHGSGLARDLVAATVGDRPSAVWVLADNARARAFYAREGWADDGSRRTHEASGCLEMRMVRRPGAVPD